MNSSDSVKNLSSALVKAQAEMGGAVKDSKNPFFKSNYADLTSVIKAIKEAFANHGLGYVQFPISDAHSVGVVTRLIHESGEWLEQEFTTPLQKVDPQSVGALISYYRRFGLQCMAGIPSVDDDGQMATIKTDSGNMTPSEVKVIKDLISQTETDAKKFCQAYNIKAVEDLPKKQFHHAKNNLERKIK